MTGGFNSHELLDELSRKGAVNLFGHVDGSWSARLKYPAPEGIIAEAQSGYGHTTHTAALLQLKKRMGTLGDIVKGERADNVKRISAR